MISLNQVIIEIPSDITVEEGIQQYELSIKVIKIKWLIAMGAACILTSTITLWISHNF